ncbi:serpin family protein [Actinoplanes sp. CA-030573]|uniref:serpin family protein n=1 Tax=Actinoplanes sp. CA-030573 TaxID=3239898 RepID=UPI003D948EC1
MRTPKSLVLVLIGALMLAACGKAVPGDAGRIDAELVSDLGPGDAQAVAGAVDEFGFDLFRQVATGDRNTVTSPLSVSVLLAMVLAGADGDTATRMARVLHLEQRRDVRVGGLLRALADTDDVKLSVADGLWTGVPLRDDYRDFVRRTFGATVEKADLGDAATARKIDEWASKNTGKRIDRIAGDLGLPDPQMALVLLNAVYFLGKWRTQFDQGFTRPGPFRTPGGSVTVPIMHMSEATFGYAELDGYRMLRLPYGEQGRYGMEILLPDPGTSLPGLLKRLDAAEWRAAAGALSDQEISELALPRFELRWSSPLLGPLRRMGLPTTGFTGLSAADPALTAVVHKTYIRVDEKGTEAAAVTGGAMAMSARVGGASFVVDRPFAFTVSDRRTGAILFLGAVADPRS